MNKDKDKITSDGRENLLLRFLGGLALLAVLMMLTAGSCDKKKTDGGSTPPGGQNPENKIVPCSERGFTVKVANDNFAKAFKVGDFSKDANGAFNAEVTVTLSALTRANGFVSNHVWINPSEEVFNGYAYQEAGTLAPSDGDAKDLKQTAITPGGDASTATAGADGKFCLYGATGTFSVAPTKRTLGGFGTNNDKISPTYENYATYAPTAGTEFLYEGTASFDSLKAANDADPSSERRCLDFTAHGHILELGVAYESGKKQYGALPIGVYGPMNAPSADGSAVTLVAAPAYDLKYEENILETGAYYARDNGAIAYKTAAEANANMGPKPGTTADASDADLTLMDTTPVVQKNDTDALYKEIVKAFGIAGVAMAPLAKVFKADTNMGAESIFLRQPAGKQANNTDSFDSPAVGGATPGVIPNGGAGTSANGGWQKLFTISPCADEMKNGFAVAYNKGTDKDLKAWLKEPTFTMDGTVGAAALPTANAKSVVMRPGKKDSGNSHAFLFESLVSADATAANSLGFFTVQHSAAIGGTPDAPTYTIEDAALNKNALMTKGSLVCRSAMALKDTTGDGAVTGKVAVDTISKVSTSVGDLGKYTNTFVGYKDAEIKEDNKGLGLTCYLGLTALWPDAIDGSPISTKIYEAQFKTDEADRKVDDKFDVSSKYLSLLMVNIPEDIAINDALLKPYFLTQFSAAGAVGTVGDQGKVEAEATHTNGGKKFLSDIKADTNETKIDYITGSLKVSFTK